MNRSVDGSSEMFLTKWRTVAFSKNPYRLRKNKFQIINFGWVLALFLVLFIIYISLPTKNYTYEHNDQTNPSLLIITSNYNYTYPLTRPLANKITKGQTFRIAIIADLDTNSHKTKDSSQYASFYMKGHLTCSPNLDEFSIKWDKEEPKMFESGYSLKGRGMELSELVTFNGRLLTFDDRTGIVFEISNDMVSPWVILTDGDGPSTKGFKSEWATVKDQMLYVGSMGKEWTNAAGTFENYNPMFVKAINIHGEVKTLNWVRNYKAIRSIVDIEWPGYLIHESGVWSSENHQWVFLPRRCSKDRYNETVDEHKGCNYLITADDTFSKIKAIQIGTLKPTRGYSSFKFLPGSNDSIIVALKTEEVNGLTATYITVFDMKGKIFIDDEKVETEYKFEGFEFI